MDDIAQALTESLDRGGRGGMLAPFRFSDGTIMQPGASWTLETGSGFSRTDVGVLNTSILGALIMSWTQNGMVVPAGKRITITDPPVDPTDAVNLAALGTLPSDGTISDGGGNSYAIGYRDIPRTDVTWERGKCLVTTVGVVLSAASVAEGYTYTVLNASGSAINIVPDTGVELKVTGSNVSADFSLGPWTLVTIWCESATVARVAAVLALTAGDVIAALGYTPYDAANPAGYLNAITASQIITALGYNPVAPAGTFATGTWNININGNAATATALVGGLPNLGVVHAVSNELTIPQGNQYLTSNYASGTVTGTVPNRAPDSFNCVFRCKVAEGGYQVGDEVTPTMETANAYVFAVSANATRWQLNWAGAGPQLRRTDNQNSGFGPSAPNWALVFRATWLP
jgi:hypothetical protein